MDFLASNSTSRLIRRVMVLFPLFKGIQKVDIWVEVYHGAHPCSTLFIADMVRRRAFGELAGSVEAILTLFFLLKTLFVRWINRCNS